MATSGNSPPTQRWPDYECFRVSGKRSSTTELRSRHAEKIEPPRIKALSLLVAGLNNQGGREFMRVSIVTIAIAASAPVMAANPIGDQPPAVRPVLSKPAVEISTGFEYQEGKYGTGQKVEIISIPTSVRVITGRFQFSAITRGFRTGCRLVFSALQGCPKDRRTSARAFNSA